MANPTIDLESAKPLNPPIDIESARPYAPPSPPTPDVPFLQYILSPEAYEWTKQNIIDPEEYVGRAAARAMQPTAEKLANYTSSALQAMGIDVHLQPPEMPADEPKRGGMQGHMAHIAETVSTPAGAFLTGMMPWRMLAGSVAGEEARQHGASPFGQAVAGFGATMAMGVPSVVRAAAANPSAMSNWLASHIGRTAVFGTSEALGHATGLGFPYTEFLSAAASAAAPYVTRLVQASPRALIPALGGAYMGTPSGTTPSNLLTPGEPQNMVPPRGIFY